MKVNEGRLDRTIRIVAGLFIVSLVFWGPKSSFGWLGLLPILNGIIGVCPLYTLLGISTKKEKSDKV